VHKVINEDKTKPVIDIRGASDTYTVEAHPSKKYAELGATCSDQVDGWISSRVVMTHGQSGKPNFQKPGVYQVIYNCADKNKNTAPTLVKVITVQDTTCPVCPAQKTIKIEASFPYKDIKPVCTDSLDGKIQSQASTSQAVNIEKTGKYYITYRAQDSAKNWNDGKCKGSQKAPVKTIIVIDTLVPVIALHLKHHMVQVGTDFNKKGVNGEANPAHFFNYKDSAWKLYRKHPNMKIANKHLVGNPWLDSRYVPGHKLMAESSPSSSDAWIVAAAASGVVGLALLAYAGRQSTTVPV